MIFGIGTDIMDGNVGSGKFLLFTKPDADGPGKDAIHDKTTYEGEYDGRQGSQQLGNKGYPPHEIGRAHV